MPTLTISPATSNSFVSEIERDQIERDLALIAEIEAFAQLIPNRRGEAGLGELPESAVHDSYTDTENDQP